MGNGIDTNIFCTATPDRIADYLVFSMKSTTPDQSAHRLEEALNLLKKCKGTEAEKTARFEQISARFAEKTEAGHSKSSLSNYAGFGLGVAGMLVGGAGIVLGVGTTIGFLAASGTVIGLTTLGSLAAPILIPAAFVTAVSALILWGSSELASSNYKEIKESPPPSHQPIHVSPEEAITRSDRPHLAH